MFRAADTDYDIATANLELFDRAAENVVCWGVRIVGQSRGSSEGMQSWNPAILAEVLRETQAGEVTHWRDIAGTTVKWDEPSEDPQALFEVFGTHAVYDCTLQLVKTPDGSRVRLILQGLVDINVDHQRVPIQVDTVLGVAPWPMGDDSEQECLNRYQQLGFKDPVEFRVIDEVSSLVFLNQ